MKEEKIVKVGINHPSLAAYLSFILCLLIISVWFIDHFKTAIVPVKNVPSIYEEKYYDCPGVGLQPSSSVTGEGCTNYCMVGCKFNHTEQKIKNNPEGTGIIMYWD